MTRALPCLLLLLACRGPTALRTTSFEGQTDGDGLLWVDVDVERGDRALLLTAISAQGGVAVEAVYDDWGREALSWEDWWDSPTSLTGAIYPSVDTVLNWPVRAEDRDLDRGLWSVLLSVTDPNGNYQPGVALSGTVQIKQDDHLQEGTVRVLLVFAEGVDQEPGVAEALDLAVARWREVWAGVGLTPQITYATSDLNPELSIDTGSDALLVLSEQSTPRDVLVVVGERINRDTELFGIAGSIPGTLGSSTRAGVYISWLANAGGDATFSDEDIRLFGETLAHEVGHYAGLFHPVEASYDLWDALDDTLRCDSWQLCEGRLGQNLMFPYPICDASGCLAQDELTGDQAGVFHRYTGTL